MKLRGNKHGGNNSIDARADNRLSLDEIAKELGTSKSTLKELLEIERKLTPELKDILNNGAFTKTTAYPVKHTINIIIMI